jgi:predicted nuclease of restriction endonuclease-like (RecB) superfamily
MRDFSRAWTEEEMLQCGVATLPWGHIIELLGIRETEVRAWYVERASEWTRPVLQHHIADGLYLAQGAAPSNFERALPPGDAEAAQALTRDPLVVDFIRGIPGRERDLELALLADIERFMTALGKGFSFYGRQLALVVGDREFIIDLLFYHHPQRRFVVIELKVGEFDPEQARPAYSQIPSRVRPTSEPYVVVPEPGRAAYSSSTVSCAATLTLGADPPPSRRASPSSASSVRSWRW